MSRRQRRVGLGMLRNRARGSRIKHEAELAWWLEEWDVAFKNGGHNPSDALEILGEDAGETYEDRRWQQARAEVLRVVAESKLANADFFNGKTVVDIGCGPLGFPDACPAHISIGVDPLAKGYADAGLLLNSSALYLNARAEDLPLISGCADVVLMRNCLDHVDEPASAVAEARRILRPGGTLVLNADFEHTPTAMEPHSLSLNDVRQWLTGMKIEREVPMGYAHGQDGFAMVVVASSTDGRQL